ncbi:phage tail protein [Providencia rettgeri]
MTKIFKVPFATQGDRTSIPDELQADGSVSYTQGYGYDYERDQASDPAAKDIARDVMNGMFHDITEAVGELQGFGFPQWATDGKPYPVRSVVYHKEKVWQSTIANNNDEPALNNSWRELKADITAGDIDAYTKGESDKRFQPLGNYQLEGDYLKTSGITQSTGTSTTSVMSQKAVTQELTKYATVENVNEKFNQANDNANSRVPSARKVNNKALSVDISLNAGDVGAYTKAEVDSKFAAGSGLGYGQTWQNVTASRVIGTNYTNATGKPIFVSVSTNGARDNYIGLDAYVNDVLVARSVGYGGNSKPQATIIVPPGATYKFNYSSGVVGNGISIWSELR